MMDPRALALGVLVVWQYVFIRNAPSVVPPNLSSRLPSPVVASGPSTEAPNVFEWPFTRIDIHVPGIGLGGESTIVDALGGLMDWFQSNMGWDIVLAAILIIIHLFAWLPQKGVNQGNPDDKVRALGATTMTSTATAGITAVSILIPASLLVVEFSRDEAGALVAGTVDQVFRGAIWLLLSLVAGLFVLWLIPMRAQVEDVSRKFGVGLPYGIQLILLFVGVIRLVLGLDATIYGGQ